MFFSMAVSFFMLDLLLKPTVSRFQKRGEIVRLSIGEQESENEVLDYDNMVALGILFTS